MYVATRQIRVRYGETDRMGNLYYGFYSLYYEEGRTDAMRQLGLSYRELEDSGILLPVIEMKAKFILPAHYDELLTVKSIINEMPTRKLRFVTEIYNEEEQLINLSEVMLLFISKESRRPVSAPRVLVEKLQPYFDQKAVSG